MTNRSLKVPDSSLGGVAAAAGWSWPKPAAPANSARKAMRMGVVMPSNIKPADYFGWQKADVMSRQYEPAVRGQHGASIPPYLTLTSNNAIQYCTDCKLNPTRIRPTPKT